RQLHDQRSRPGRHRRVRRRRHDDGRRSRAGGSRHRHAHLPEVTSLEEPTMPIALAQHLSVQRVDHSIINALSPLSMLDIWLGAHPKVANAMYYDGKHYVGTWPTWPDGLKQDLAGRWAAMVAWYGNHMPSP